MSTVTTPVKKDQSNGSSHEVKNGVDNHKMAAMHHEEAAKNHHDAAKHHDDGNHEMAAHSTVIANGHSTIAHEAQKEDAKQHALTAKK